MTTDAEAFFFLHDLISSYLKEKERVLNIQNQQNKSKEASSSLTPSGLDKNGLDGGKKSDGNKTNGDAKKPAEGASASGSKSASDSSTKLKDASGHIDPLQNDWRMFECNTWHLEPTVRLISWAGSQIEPYGIDYILQRLGFNHARTTIPKWCQRGCMDPLDKILSVIVLKTIQAVKEEREDHGGHGGQGQAPHHPMTSSTEMKRRRPF